MLNAKTTAYTAIIKNLPSNWRAGFTGTGRYVIACGGKEEPIFNNGRWHLLVWDTEERKHLDYCFENDIFTEK